MPSILDNLPVPAVMVKKLANDMDNRVLRLRFAGNNGKDLAALVMYFETAWLLAGEMDNGQELRDKLENGVRELGKAVLSSPDAVHGPIYDTILDLTAVTTAVVAESTKKEYREASERIKSDGVVPFADEFLVVLAQANLLHIVNAEKAFKAWEAIIPADSLYDKFRTLVKTVRRNHEAIFNYWDSGNLTNAFTECETTLSGLLTELDGVTALKS